jgi:Ino eighty subunit 2
LSRTPPPGGKNSLKLTVKAAPSKLRQAISGSQLPPNPYTDDASESDATPKPTARTARATRNPRTVVEQDSDEDDEDEDEDAEGEDDDDEDADGEEVDQELLANEDSQEDAEGEEDDDMDDVPGSHPPPPVIKQQKIPGKSKANVTVSAPASGPLKSVEAKELEDDDDELSDLESGDEMELGEGEEEEDIGDDDDDLSGSDIDGSRSATPDPSKLTRRQRGVFEEENVGLLALSNEAQKKKLLSVEEHAMRRQEMARRRKNLSEKRNEEEKVRP